MLLLLLCCMALPRLLRLVGSGVLAFAAAPLAGKQLHIILSSVHGSALVGLVGSGEGHPAGRGGLKKVG